MKLETIIEKPEHTRLILIYAGWGAGPEVAKDVEITGWDVAVVHDFSDLGLDCEFLNRYYTIYLFAWSLGVAAAELTLPVERITAAFALNGTPLPVSDTYGIPTEIYEKTAETLTERNLMKFRIRMAGSRENAERMGEAYNKDIPNLQHQLEIIRTASGSLSAPSLPWVRAYLATGDRIFPHANMQAYWSGIEGVKIIDLDGPHYIPLERVIKSIIPDTARVSQKFTRAHISYDTHAIAQYSIALKLASKLAAMNAPAGCRVLEIGCGTGLYTREYLPALHAGEATFVDITPSPVFGIVPAEKYAVEDAESWMEKDHEQWDVITSASTIQWFSDVPRFLQLCYKHLRPGGILAISSFTAGNLEELDKYRPAPLVYHTAEHMRKWLQRDFSEVSVEEDVVEVEFKSLRDMLMHLKHTGVGGSAGEAKLPLREMTNEKKLTYRPLYLTARKPK